MKIFFEERSFPNKFTWDDMKMCCISDHKYQGKEIFKEICYSMMGGFSKYRYLKLIKYSEKAFQDSLMNRDYILGEVPLTEQKKENLHLRVSL